MALRDVVAPVASFPIRVKPQRLHAMLQPAKPIPALAVFIQTRSLGEVPLLTTVVHLALVHLGGAEGDRGLDLAHRQLPVLHTAHGLRVKHPGLAAVVREAPAHETLAVRVATPLTGG